MSHVTEYHAALARWHDDPIALSERDYAILEEYGGRHQVVSARKAAADAVAPVVDHPARPAVTVADVQKALQQLDDAILTLFKVHTFPRLIALEQRLAKVDGIPVPTGPVSAKPKVKLAGEWTRKMFEPGVGVTHGGKLFHCVRATFTEPSKDPTSWEQVA